MRFLLDALPDPKGQGLLHQHAAVAHVVNRSSHHVAELRRELLDVERDVHHDLGRVLVVRDERINTSVAKAGNVVHGDSNDVETIISCVMESLAGNG